MPRGQDHVRLDDCAPHRIAFADHGRLGYSGVLDQCAFDLEWADSIAGADDYVVGSSHKPEVAVAIDVGAVARDVPVAALRCFRGRFVSPVFLEQADRALGTKAHSDVALVVWAEHLP